MLIVDGFSTDEDVARYSFDGIQRVESPHLDAARVTLNGDISIDYVCGIVDGDDDDDLDDSNRLGASGGEIMWRFGAAGSSLNEICDTPAVGSASIVR